MAQPQDKSKFFSKLAKFVTNPTTEWSQLDSVMPNLDDPSTQMHDMEISHIELEKMHRQRRRYDLRVRKREFAMLRKVKAKGISPEEFQSTLLNHLSVPKSQVRESRLGRATDQAIKITQINQIEKQMADLWWSNEAAEEQPVIHRGAPPETTAKAQPQADAPSPARKPAAAPAPAAAAQAASPAAPAAGAAGTAESLPHLLEFDQSALSYVPAAAAAEAVDDPVLDIASELPATEAVNFESSVELDGSDTVRLMTPLPPLDMPIPTTEGLTMPFTQPPTQFMVETQFGVTNSERSQAVDTEKIAETSADVVQFDMPVPDKVSHVVDTERAIAPDAIVQHGFTFQPALVSQDTERQVQDLPDCLNQPAVLFAQGKNSEAEQALQHILQQSASPQQPAQVMTEEDVIDVRLALLDFYRATRNEEEFDAAALDLIRNCDRSPPQYWVEVATGGASTQLPAQQHSTRFAPDTLHGATHWECPAVLDMMAVLLLRTQLSRTTPEILLDWRLLTRVDPAALQPLLDQFRELADRHVELIMWGGAHLLQQIANTPVTDANDRAICWQLRLELVRIMYRQEDFDALALEYCLELEVSPPAWVQPRATFVEASMGDDTGIDTQTGEADATTVQPAPAQASAAAQKGTGRKLSGNLSHPLVWTAEICGAQAELFEAVASASLKQSVCEIDCLGLDRMDYPAAAELLAWLSRRSDSDIPVRFVNTHRLLAMFWRMLGITTHAKVELRRD